MKFYIAISTDPAFNLALEETLARSCAPDATFMLWRNEKAVVTGRNQLTLAETDMDYIRANNIRVVRRMTGGGAVYHDLGNVNFTYLSKPDTPIPPTFAALAAPVAGVLREMGVPVVFSGRNDMTADGAKFSGCAQSVIGKRVILHGTLLFDSNLETLASALRPDPEKITTKHIASIRSRVVNLKKYIPSMDSDTFMRELAMRLMTRLAVSAPDIIPPEIMLDAAMLADSKYRSDEWNFNSSPDFGYRKKLRFNGGSATLELTVSNGIMKEIRLSGDFFGSKDTCEITSALRSNHLRDAKKILEKFNLEEYISGMTREELESLFPTV